MAKVIEQNIGMHTAEALIVSDPSDFRDIEQDFLKIHYPGIFEVLADLMADPDWAMGRIYPHEIDGKKVIFVQIRKEGKPTYEGVRDCVRKIANNMDKLGSKHFAMGRLGCFDGGLHIGALEPVVAAAEYGGGLDANGKRVEPSKTQLIMVDIFRGEP